MFTLGRKVSLTYRTNQIILSLSLIYGIICYILTTDIAQSAVAAGSLFVSWALVREIDCRREYAAFVAVGIYMILQLLFPFHISLADLSDDSTNAGNQSDYRKASFSD
ncbi:hypothetical protein [Halolactibacillus sp. JCM 19043]|uniref:hypothetical protein n=1 Tax=Halolactibacillus sp. JCM 19043 TaxID=1460638 RepID=UPI0007847658|nr:hypothetical protein [Halolactibacillus sp. JCM 19043]